MQRYKGSQSAFLRDFATDVFEVDNVDRINLVHRRDELCLPLWIALFDVPRGSAESPAISERCCGGYFNLSTAAQLH